jgi:ribonuclease-3
VPAAEPAPAELVSRLGIKPLPDELLTRALTHASFVNEAGNEAESNERLEFLGDAFLGMVIAHELFRRYPEAGEGPLTRMRAHLVRGSTLARVAQRLDLGRHVILGKGEEAVGGRTRERNLAGALEAVIGAVYVAHGYRTARSLVLRILAPELVALRKEGARIDAKSSLQHLVQARWHEPPAYVTVAETNDGVTRCFTVEVKVGGNILGRGEGSSKREAQQQAARAAIARLASAAED